MSYIQSHLQPGEQVITRVRRSRRWYHILLMLVGFLVVVPLYFLVMAYFFLPLLASLLSDSAAVLIMFGLFVLVLIALLFDLLHFFIDELALTDRRLLGSVQGRSSWVFPKVDIPLAAIEKVRTGINMIEIVRRDGARAVTASNLYQGKEFAAQVNAAIQPKG